MDYAREKTAMPGLAMLIVGLFGILLNLAYGGWTVVSTLVLPLISGTDIGTILSYGVVGLVQGTNFLLCVVGSAIIAFAGMRLRSVRSAGIVYLGAILAALPMCGSGMCCCVGLPVALWVIVTMQDEQVKAAFAE